MKKKKGQRSRTLPKRKDIHRGKGGKEKKEIPDRGGNSGR